MEQLISLLTNGGPYALAGVMGFLYWCERQERQAAQDRCQEVYRDFFERLLNGLNAASQATREGANAVNVATNTFQSAFYRLRDSQGKDDR